LVHDSLNLAMITKKQIYNYFIFTWFGFGLVIFAYHLSKSLVENEFMFLEFREKLTLVIPTLILLLYCVSFLKYKFKNYKLKE